MSDIVERLLKDAESHYEVARSADMRPEDTLNWEHGQNCQDAADTITRLTEEVEDLGNRLHHVHRLWANNEHALRAENEKLRAALERMLLEFDFMVEREIIPDVRNDVIFVEARAALSGDKQ